MSESWNFPRDYTLPTDYDNSLYPYRCKEHVPVDTGFKVSECKKCQVRLEFANWEWKEKP